MVVRGKQGGGGNEQFPVGSGQRPTGVGKCDSLFDQKMTPFLPLRL